MISYTCRRCGSKNLRKNGRTKTQQQKFHCKDCNFYSTLTTQEAERSARYAHIEKLHRERISQRGIARATGVSRSTIIRHLKKRHFNRLLPQ